MSDPWTTFTAAAESAEVAGYFERTPRAGRPGSATWFTRPEETVAITRSSDPTEIARATRRFLGSHPHGAVTGYVGFDAVGLFEPALRRFPPHGPFPLGEVAFVRSASSGPVPRRRRRPLRRSGPARPLSDTSPPTAFSRSVRRLVRAIVDGEAFQVVLAHRREWRRPNDLFVRAGALRDSERYSFFYYLRYHDREIIGATPESVVELHGNDAVVNPIAGTVPNRERGRRLPLTSDPKELAEHRMLVDLARNDLGRVARPGSVRILERERRERYSRLEHLVSRVGARMRPGVGPWELLGVTFPAGTVSGAPKIRATELLRAEEGTWRGPYGGAVGCLRPGNRAEWALCIRSAFAAGDRMYTTAGAGIVHLSSPRREFDETIAKLAHLEAVMGGVRP